MNKQPKMNHAFSDVTADGLILALTCLMTAKHNGKEQVVTLQTSTDNRYVMTLSDRNMSNPETGKPRNQRVLSSTDFAHLLWSGLNENHEALVGFKNVTGWSK
jgi:hypothetical protein